MLSYLAAAAMLVCLFGASLGVERLLGRSRKEMVKPGWYVIFFLLFLPAVYAVYAYLSVDSPFLYAAYAGAGGLSALVAQALFGLKLSQRSTSKGGGNA
ncbi:MAG: hypothetical protein AB7I35_08625 [Ramlibacter sp.]